jgi:hypothetical protein
MNAADTPVRVRYSDRHGDPAANRSHAAGASLWSSGAMAGLFSMAALAVRGRAETGSAAAPLNAVTHWLFGRRALRVDRADLRHTALGTLVHVASSMFWAVFYDRIVCRRVPPPTTATLVAGAVGITALAAVTDFKLVPERLTPGFEHRLSKSSLVLTYALFAAGLALGGIVARRMG